ncbi:MAG: ABC transporter substrate-binding protein [Neomegalonema sp.]|nr:ABC transporter substrate-binding protein [Neomegalonema sp.]
MRWRSRLSLAVLMTATWLVPLQAAPPKTSVDILYLQEQRERPPTLSNLDPVPEDLGLAGARQALKDNATTGKFLGHDYQLSEQILAPGEDIVAAARAQLSAGARLLVLNASAGSVQAIADLPEARDALIFNGAAPDDALRREGCRANVLHSIPSRAMLTDALAQFLIQKRWRRWFLVEGTHEGDKAYADALRRSAIKFNAKIVAEKTWAFDADMRRNAAQEVPLFTQGPDYDVLLVADELDDFGRYIPFNTWDPRPIAGTEGLTPVPWSRVVEQWGAAQLQSRFEKNAERAMLGTDYGVWAAIRSIGEAVTRTNSADAATLRAFILSDKFELAGFLGRKMSYRAWNGQLRQPIPLVHPRALAAQAPLEGFLHQRTELDTLGIDQAEPGCTAFKD